MCLFHVKPDRACLDNFQDTAEWIDWLDEFYASLRDLAEVPFTKQEDHSAVFVVLDSVAREERNNVGSRSR